MAIGVIGLGAHVPDEVITNARISEWTGMGEDWIVERTGIHERRYAAPETATSDLAVPAANAALDAEAGARDRLEALIVATVTPDVPQPATAAILQHKLGLRAVPAFDVNAVCSGFVYSLAIGEGLLRAHYPGGRVLVVGADKLSSVMDRSDRRTVSLFGDGAGAMLLGEVPEGYGFLGTRMITDGEHHASVGVDAGGTAMPLDAEARAAGRHLLHMDGRRVKSWVMPTMRKLVEQVLDDCGLGIGDISRFVFHQANTRMLEALAADLGIGLDRVPVTARRYGNTGGASVPFTLSESHRRSPLRRGERVLLAAAGGGLCAGATILVWH
ncbi:3-oxoacyl-ACP synthase III family protein [Sphaerisporangium corydalis]|uniref:3-oxoacyl-ACP synthase III family protein n=1 Tax=Sphaerisporangium corydalis TaxID=1441875 RepID=A0ABV9EFZ8_9ACTN|nr:ketoacyl-ACP synthase III [Sphaerisporangium corydalis]